MVVQNQSIVSIEAFCKRSLTTFHTFSVILISDEIAGQSGKVKILFFFRGRPDTPVRNEEERCLVTEKGSSHIGSGC